jgi:hypothetical protein
VKLLTISALAVATALSLGACGQDGVTGSDGLRIGQFDGQIVGTRGGLLGGEAASGSTVPGYHDIIVLTDYAANIEITLYHDTDEFFLGRYAIGDAANGYLPIVAYVHLLDTDEWFQSLDGMIDLSSMHTNGFDGTASFSAESSEVTGDIVNVDVAFITDYAGRIDYNLSPSFSRTPKSAAGGS